VQGTVASFDETSGSGTLVTDLGAVVSFPGDAFARSGLRVLRPGQRVTVTLDAAGEVELVTIPGFPNAIRPGPPPP
jgi:cold shock CspA family protein